MNLPSRSTTPDASLTKITAQKKTPEVAGTNSPCSPTKPVGRPTNLAGRKKKPATARTNSSGCPTKPKEYQPGLTEPVLHLKGINPESIKTLKKLCSL